jgi:hypothetical protein
VAVIESIILRRPAESWEIMFIGDEYIFTTNVHALSSQSFKSVNPPLRPRLHRMQVAFFADPVSSLGTIFN